MSRTETPLISIIIPCYNAEKRLKKSLGSVVNQNYKNIEIIIVDDGSTDASSEIYGSFLNDDDRIKVVKQTNQGVARARNVGINAATGDFVCFVDSDDWVEKEYCTELLELLTANNADISIIEGSYENENGDIVFHKPISNEIIFDGQKALALLLEDQEIQSHPWGKLFKSSLLKNISFPENLKCFEDYSTLFKIFDKAVIVAKSNKKLYHYIQHDDSLSHNLSPQTAYLFFLAIMEVFKFWEKSQKPENQNKITRNIIRKLLMVLKRIIRNTSTNQMTSEKEEIRQSIKPFLRQSPFAIGLEYYFYLRLYYFFPKLYARLISR